METRQAEIANAKLAELKASKGEPKGAPVDDPSTKKTEGKVETPKEKETPKVEQLKAETPKETVTAAREEAKAQVKEDKSKTEEPVKDKEKSRQEKIDKRIGELTGTIKDLTRKIESLEQDGQASKGEIDTIRQEKDALEKELNMSPADKAKSTVKKVEEERISKYITEDKDKPKAERREMTEEALSDWLIEDYTQAQRWLVRNERRRELEREAFIQETRNIQRRRDLLNKQQPYEKKVLEKYPELDTTKREVELKAEGKNAQEIHKILIKENDKYRICSEIVKENPEKYLMAENGPELVVEEMEKRATPKKKSLSEEEKAKIASEAAEAERQRQSRADADMSSSRHTEKTEKSDFRKQQEALASKAGISPDRLSAVLNRRKSIPGAELDDKE